MLSVYDSGSRRQGEESKLERLYFSYRDLMFYIANQILKNTQDAEDAVQQAFVSMAKHMDKIGEPDSQTTRSYVAVITERKAIDILRKKGQVELVAYDDDAIGIEIPLPGDSGLADAMARLPARYREILLLRYDNGYTTRELAKILELPQGTVQKLIWRAKEALGKIMKKDGATL